MMKKIKILHVLGGLEAGGVETWLYNVVNNLSQDKYETDFLIFSGKDGAYGRQLRDRGCAVIKAPKTKNIFVIRSFYRKVVKKGNYDIVHVHRHLLSGIYLLFNRGISNKFIIHSHNTFTDSRIFKNKIIEKIFKRIVKSAPYKVSCSKEAGLALFGEEGEVIAYGIFTERFKPLLTKLDLIPEHYQPQSGDVVVGHVGRFTEQKNHRLILEIAANLVKSDPKYHFVFIGEGILEEQIKQLIRESKLERNVHMIGFRENVSDYMRGFFDIFLFPSLYEGFGIVLLEAQCAAIPLVFSKNLPENVDIVPELITRIDLKSPSNSWEQALSSISPLKYEDRLELFSQFKKSEYSIESSSEKVNQYYTRILNSKS